MQVWSDSVMKMGGTWIFLGIVGVVGSTCAGVEDRKDSSPATQAAESLVDAIRQAARPSRGMRVEWVYETVDPVYAVLGQPGEVDIPKEWPHTVREYVATIKGICSRIERLDKTYETIRSEEPRTIDFSTAVFNGRQQRKLTNHIKNVLNTPQGWQYQMDKNSFELSEQLFGWPLDLNNQETIRKCSFRLLGQDPNGMSVLEVVHEKNGVYHFTVDENRGFNPVKIVHFLSPGEKGSEVNFKLHEYANGTWYVGEYETILYWALGGEQTRRPRIQYRMKVTKAEFDIEIPDSAFTLDFPLGTKVWDGTLQASFTVGAVEPPETGGTSSAPAAQGGPAPNQEREAHEAAAARGKAKNAQGQEGPPEGTSDHARVLGVSGPVWVLLTVCGLAGVALLFHLARRKST